MAKKSKSLLVLELMASKASADSKKSRSRLCLLCQKRKQKCDHRVPSCTTCIKAGVQCIQPERYAVSGTSKDEYTLLLESRLLYLENAIDDSGNLRPGALSRYKKITPFIGAKPAVDDPLFAEGPAKIHQEIKPDPDSLEIPTFSLMNDPMRQIPDIRATSHVPGPLVAPESALPAPRVLLTLGGPVDLSQSILAKYDFLEILAHDPEYDVDPKLLRTLIDTHFVRFQVKFPFLDENEVVNFHSAYTSGNIAAYANDLDYFHFLCCRQWLIYSLNLFILKTTGDHARLEPLRLFLTALRSLGKCKITDPYQKIEIFLLAALCLVRCDRDLLEPHALAGDAMHAAVELGLHKYDAYHGCEPRQRLRKMKAFWCVYLLDRLILVLLGRPFSFPEKEIDAAIPLFGSEPGGPANYPFLNQSIRLKRLEARAMDALGIVGTNLQVLLRLELPLVEHYFEQLQAWRTDCASVSAAVEKATLGLYYFRTVRVLLQPYLALMRPEDRLLRECQAAAGQICQLFKVFHQRTVYGHLTLAINNVFVAGVTLIYCLWLTRNTEDRRRKLLGDTAKHTRPAMTASMFASLDDLRACSVCLYVMAERSKYAVVFRDTFELLLRATMGNLIERCGPDSTELIYTKTLDEVPPAVVRQPVEEYEVMPEHGQVSETFRKQQERELAENRRKRGYLERSAVPKSLSHLLAGSSEDSADNEPKKEELAPVSQTSENLKKEPPTKEILGSFENPGLSYTFGDLFGRSESTQPTSSLLPGFGFQPFSFPSQIPFPDRANDMINNISTWTEESGPVTANYINNLLGPDFGASEERKLESTTNQIFADLETLNTLAMNASSEPPTKKKKFDTKSLFNGDFKVNKG